MSDIKTRHILVEGRNLAMDEYGAKDGLPVFFFHGWPASRHEAALLDKPAQETGLRLLSMDRPGIGDSDFQPRRQLLDWPPVVKQMAAQLGINRFGIIGVSGGGPYAMACAWALGGQVSAASVVCGAPPVAELVQSGGNPDTLHKSYRVLLAWHRRNPSLVRLFFRALHPVMRRLPERAFAFLVSRPVPEVDRAVLRNPTLRAMCHADFRGAWGTAADGVFTDAEIHARPWGFPIEEIQTPVRLWHGREDSKFSWRFIETYARRVPHCTTRFLDGEGHYSLPFLRGLEVLSDLRECMEQKAMTHV